MPLEPKSYNKAGRNLDIAEQKIAAMEAAETLNEYSQAWSEYLIHIQRFFTQPLISCKLGPSKGWFDGIKNQRKNDRLLSYLLHARNAEEHGIEEITEFEPGRFSVGVSGAPGDSFRINFRMQNGVISADEETRKRLIIEDVPSRLRLVSVKDTGITYAVPNQHLGADFNSDDPVVVAKAGLAFWKAILREADGRFNS